MGIRAVQRFTGLHQETVLNILETAGQKAAAFLDANVRNVRSEYVQVDELVCFVKTKEQNTDEGDMEHGNFFTHLSVCRQSKLIVNFLVSKRSWKDSLDFMRDLRDRMAGRFTLTTDGLRAYVGKNGVVRTAFGETIDYASEVKVFAERPAGMYVFLKRNPCIVKAIKRKARIGNPDLKMSTTCHVERMNLSLRQLNRRYARLTLGYSKKLDNLKYAIALFVWHFNYCRIHSAHKQTPAQAAGLTDRVWTIADLLTATAF